MTSTQRDLSERLRSRRRTEDQQIAETTQRELQRLGEQSTKIVADALSTIETDMTAATEKVRAELDNFAAAATERVRENLRSVEATAATASATVYRLLLRRWAVSLMTGLMFSLGISVGSWVLMQSLSSEIRSDFDLLDSLRTQIAEAIETRDQLQDTTWGTGLYEVDGMRFVVLPYGTATSRPLTLRGRSAFELPSE